MRAALALLPLALSVALSAQPATDFRWTTELEDAPLPAVVAELERVSGVGFSYLTGLLADRRANCRFREADWPTVVDCLFRAQGLRVRWVGDRSANVLPQAEPAEFPVSARFRDPAGAPLPFVTVSWGADAGAATDAAGELEGRFRLLPPDSVTVTYLGYAPYRLPFSRLVDGSRPTVILVPQNIELGSVLVRDYLTEGIEATPDGREVTVRPARIAALPGFAEGEVLRLAALLPGVSSVGESAGDLSIRGGRRDQNLVLYDGIPVYAAGHYFGLVSNFVPELVDRVDVWRGLAKAELGGRVSGVIEVETGPDPVQSPEWGLNANLLYGGGYAKLPLAGGQGDLQVGLRTALNAAPGGLTYRSYRDQLFQELDGSERFDFTEVNARTGWRVGPGGRLTLSGLYLRDAFDYRETGDRPRTNLKDELVTRNAGLGLTYRSGEVRGARWELQATHTDFGNASRLAVNQGRALRERETASGIVESSLRATYARRVGTGHFLSVGGQLQRLENDYKLALSNRLGLLDSATVRRVRALAVAAYTTFGWRPGGPWTADLGLRLQAYGPTGQVLPEPRLVLGFRPADHWNLRVGYARNHQLASELLELGSRQLSTNAPVWVVAAADDDGRGQLPVAGELTAGATLSLGRLLVEVEAYRKRVHHLRVLNLQPLSSREGLGRTTARTEGVDLLLRHRRGAFHHYLTYTLSRTEWAFPRAENRTVVADNDLPHRLQYVAGLRAGRWDFGFGGQLSSGGRYTEVEITRVVRGEPPRPQFRRGELNAARLPAYLRLDLSAHYRLTRPDRGWWARVGVSLLNLTGRDNALDREYILVDRGDDLPQGEQFRLRTLDRVGLGFTPNLTLAAGWR